MHQLRLGWIKTPTSAHYAAFVPPIEWKPYRAMRNRNGVLFYAFEIFHLTETNRRQILRKL